MTVKELKEILSKCDENENVYVWKGNWPEDHYSTHIKVDTTICGKIFLKYAYLEEGNDLGDKTCGTVN